MVAALAGASEGPGTSRTRSWKIPEALWIFLVVLVTTLPYLYVALEAERLAPQGGSYNWILAPYPEDGLAYMAWVKQAQSGALLFEVKYTQIEQGAVLFQPFFLVVGWFSAVSGWGAGFSLFAARIVAVAVLLFVLGRFVDLFGLPPAARWLALLLVSCSSGLGFLLAPRGIGSADVWMPELNTLWLMTWNPLFTCGLTLMLAAIGLLIRGVTSNSGRRRDLTVLGAGALTGVLAFVHSYDVVIVCAFALVYLATTLRAAAVRPALLFAVAAGPPSLLQFFIARTHPVLSAHAASGAMSSPPPGEYIFGLGLPLLFATYGAFMAWRHHRRRVLVPLGVWVAVAFALAYAPIWFQRKLVMGVHVPICVLAALGLYELVQRLPGRWKPLRVLTLVALVAACTPTQFYNFMATTRAMAVEPEAYFVRPELREALEFLEANSRPDELVLAYHDTARHIPGAAGNTVTLGHWAQSVDLEQHMQWIGRVFSPGTRLSPAERKAELLGSAIDYIFLDEAMLREWMNGLSPGWLGDATETVYRDDGIRILHVRRPAA